MKAKPKRGDVAFYVVYDDGWDDQDEKWHAGDEAEPPSATLLQMTISSVRRKAISRCPWARYARFEGSLKLEDQPLMVYLKSDLGRHFGDSMELNEWPGRYRSTPLSAWRKALRDAKAEYGSNASVKQGRCIGMIRRQITLLKKKSRSHTANRRTPSPVSR